MMTKAELQKKIGKDITKPIGLRAGFIARTAKISQNESHQLRLPMGTGENCPVLNESMESNLPLPVPSPPSLFLAFLLKIPPTHPY